MSRQDVQQRYQDNAARELLGSLPERWGRMDVMSRATLVEVGGILRKNGMLVQDSPALASGWTGGLIIGCKRGSLAVDLEYAETIKGGPGMASPHLFGYTLPNIPLAEAAIQYGLTGPVFCLISDNPFDEALFEAGLWLQEVPGEKTFIVAGCLDAIPAGDSLDVTANLKVIHN